VIAVVAFIENPRHDLAIGIVAAVLIAFSLVAALVVPRRRPDFPGRNVGLFAVAAILLVGAMLAAVEALGESQHFGSPHAGQAADTGQVAPPSQETTTEQSQSTQTSGAGTTTATPAGNPANGKQLFATNGCGGCHAFKPAGTSGQVGPDLDKLADYAKQAKQPEAKFVHTSIVDPNAYVQPGFPAKVMPTNYDAKLSDAQLADLVAFLVQR
jgi:cytochrome c551/c552